MKLLVPLFFSIGLLAAVSGFAAEPDSGKTLAYIHKAWPTLTRSLDDCSALADSKVATHPLLYLPADFPAPAPVCSGPVASVRRLPQ